MQGRLNTVGRVEDTQTINIGYHLKKLISHGWSGLLWMCLVMLGCEVMGLSDSPLLLIFSVLSE